MKKIIALLFVTSIGYSIGYCSDGNGEAKPFRRVYVGLSFTPEVSYRYLVSNYIAPGSTSSANQSEISTANKNSAPRFGANAAFKVGINLTRWLAVESGVGYALFQYQQTYAPPLTQPPFIYTSQADETYHYMAVPVGLRFSMGHRKVRGIIAAGADLDFLLKQKVVMTESNVNTQASSTTSTVDQTKNFHTFNVSPYLGIGIDCYATPWFAIRLMPEAQIQALKNMNEPISEYLWNVGFNVSFLFGL